MADTCYVPTPVMINQLTYLLIFVEGIDISKYNFYDLRSFFGKYVYGILRILNISEQRNKMSIIFESVQDS